ncbi:MAG: T9SS type A sorting domain-containing protein [Candidatus Cloacimonetes bacterium]|nr:T9SS type A sorting domain-containing protein [Candidatus Cloacimonadota bacterium]
MEDYYTGRYSMDVNLYIPEGYCGYYNLQKTSTPGEEWGIQTMFDVDGIASIDGDGAAACTFPFDFDTWMNFVIIVDLDVDLCEFYYNGTLMHSYQWTLGCFGQGTLTSLGGMNMYAWASTGNSPLYYFDDVTLSETYGGTTRDHIGYNVYLDGVLQTIPPLGIDVFSYEYEGLIPDQAYVAGVSALYDDGESEIIEVEFIYTPVTTFDPPENLVATVVNYNEVELAWQPPGGGAGEWIHWDDGINNNAIGLVSGGSFLVASRWDPANLADYDGWDLMKVNFFPCDDMCTYEIKVWTGANAANLVLDQAVTTFVVDTWNEIILDTPITIDATDELWFGYGIVNHAAGTHPAGCDAGPAVAGFGDMISLDGVTWDSLSGLGFDFNWNLQGYVFGSDGETVAMNKKAEVGVERISTPIVEKRVLTRINSNLLSCAPTHGTRLTAEQSRDDRYLSGYKVYRDGEEIAEITDPLVLTYSDDEGLDAGDYEYYVTAIYEAPAGESDPCDSVIVTITLPAPVDVFAESVFPNIMVTWEVPPLPTRGLSHYKVYRDMVLIVDNVTGLFHIDINVPEGTYSYTVVAVYDGGWDSEHSEPYVVEHYVDAGDILIPIRTELTGNYPNPFNPATTINFALKEAGNVTIMVYNVKGEKVRNLVDCRLEAAYHSIVWDGKDNTGRNVSSGVYFYKMKAEKYSSTKKMILMK